MREHPPQVAPRPRPLSRRGWRILVVVGLVIAALYAVVIAFYNAEGSSTGTPGVTQPGPGITVGIAPVAVNAGTNQATLDLSLSANGDNLVDANGRLVSNVRVVVASSMGSQEVKFLAGEPLGRFEAIIGLDGEQSYYPFDDHVGAFGIIADTYTKATDGSLVSTGELPVGLMASGAVSGWDIVTDYPEVMQASPTAGVSLTRAFSTRAFAIVMLLLAVFLSIVSLVVGILLFTNRRKAEVAVMSWAAAVLFALPLLRTYFPNAPPVGVSMDIYVYLWVIVAAVVAAVLDVFAWLNQNRAALEAKLEAHAEQHNAT